MTTEQKGSQTQEDQNMTEFSMNFFSIKVHGLKALEHLVRERFPQIYSDARQFHDLDATHQYGPEWNDLHDEYLGQNDTNMDTPKGKIFWETVRVVSELDARGKLEGI